MLHYIKKSYISGQSAKLYLYSAHEKPVKYAKEVEAILKRISVKFQQQEQTYRSLHAAARSLLSSKGRVFLLFLLFYKVLTNFLFVPALQLIWALTLRFAPIQYLNNKTASHLCLPCHHRVHRRAGGAGSLLEPIRGCRDAAAIDAGAAR